MRVHLRGVVIGVGVLLSVVLIVSIFNAYDASADGKSSRHALSMEGEEEEAGLSPSRMSPRSSTRLRAQGGPGGRRPGGAGGPGARAGGPGARAGGPGARAGGPGARAGGMGARAGGPGARAGGPGARMGAGGPRAGRMGGANARGMSAGTELPDYGDVEDEEDDDDFEFDETPTEDVEEEEETLPRGRAGGAAARLSGRPGASGARARGRAVDDDDIMPDSTLDVQSGSSRRRSSREKSKENKSKEKEEKKVEEPPKKKEPVYPEWWKTSYSRSSAFSVRDQFAGDQPLFPECPTFEAGSAGLKVKRYGPVEPPNFMRNSKNPCWFEWNGKKDILKCVPYFYVAGVPKAGVADLFNRVHGHPSVMAGGSDSYYWWDRLRYGASKTLKYTREAKRTEDIVQLKEYAKFLVGNHGKNITKELLYLGRSESIFGDASPTYLVENTQWDVFEGNEGCSEPRVIPASFIRHIFPDARIIIMLRDPIERVYSRFLANVPYVQEFENATASLFHTFTAQAVQNYRQCFAKTSVRHCAYNASLFSNSVIRLSEGMYPVFLEDWFRVFPREQILIIRFEDYIKDVQGHLQQVFDHLELDPVSEYSMLKLAELPVVRKGRVREEAGFMMAETVTLLKEFYSPFLTKLADMLDDEKWLFEKNDIPVAPPRNVDTEEEGNNEVPANQAEPEEVKEEEGKKEESKAQEGAEPKREETRQPDADDDGGEDI